MPRRILLGIEPESIRIFMYNCTQFPRCHLAEKLYKPMYNCFLVPAIAKTNCRADETRKTKDNVQFMNSDCRLTTQS